MRLPFLTPSAERVSADGHIELVHGGGSLGRLRPKVRLLARDLCTFQVFEAAALPRGRRRRAAMLFGRTAAPYVASGMVIVPAGDDFGVWWWDLDRISALIPDYAAAAVVIRPETLAQPAGEGWRIVRLAHGYEGQLWRGGRLLASSWRPQRFDATSWAAFTRLQRDGSDAPETPPVPVVLPIAQDSEAFAFSVAEISPRQAAMAAGGGMAFVTLLATLFLLGQGLRLADDRRALEQEVTELRASLPTATTAQTQDIDRRRLTTFAELEQRTNPLTAAGAALGIVALYDIEPISLDSDEETLTITVPYAALRSIDSLVEEFETSGYFYDVEPRTEAGSETLVIAAKVRLAAVQPG